MKTPKSLSRYMALIGAKGGSVKGPQKKRSVEHYKRASAKRWGKKPTPN